MIWPEPRQGAANTHSIRARGCGSRRARMIVAAALPSILCVSRAFGDNFTWTGPSGPQSYSVPGNWNPSGPPGASDIPVFNSNQSNTIEFAGDHSHLALQVLQGTLVFQPDAGAEPVQRLMSLSIDSFVNGGSLALAGLPGEGNRGFRMELAENLYVGGDLFAAGNSSGLALTAGSRMQVGQNLKLWSAGALTIDGGAMQAGTFDHTGGGTFNFTAGRLSAGTFLGNLTSAGGTIAPGASAGVMRVTGNLQMNGGAIEIELGGFTPGIDNDQLQIEGAAAFGTSDVLIRTLDDFIPLPGDVFEIATYTSGTGTPTIMNQTPYAGLTFTHQLTANSLAIRAEALLPGDADLNAVVDARDLFAMASHWLSAGNWLEGDFDGNGFIDKADLTLLAQNWQAGVAGAAFDEVARGLGLPGSSVPEPSGLWAVALGLLGLRRRQRKG